MPGAFGGAIEDWRRRIQQLEGAPELVGAAPFLSLSSDSIISQRFAHDPRKDREKVSPIPPYGSFVLISQTQISLMH